MLGVLLYASLWVLDSAYILKKIVADLEIYEMI